MIEKQFQIRLAKPQEFTELGNLMVSVYSQLDGFPKQGEQPKYYEMLANIGTQTEKPGAELIVAISPNGVIGGGVVFYGDMQYYGSGGTAIEEKDASGFRLLAVEPKARGLGLGKHLSMECVNRARNLKHRQVIIHSTKAMQIAWKMYEKLGFKRSEDLDFMQGELPVFGFRLKI